MPHSFQTVSSRSAIAPIAADIIATAILDDVQTRGNASLMLSGGSTPGATFEALSHYDLPWDKVTIGLVDDRWVPESDAGSNGALIRRTLLKNKASSASFTAMKTKHGTPHEAAIAAPITAKKSKVTGDYLDRMTLTLPAIATAKSALLLLTGAEKRGVFSGAAANPALDYPITHAITALGDRLITLYAD